MINLRASKPTFQITADGGRFDSSRVLSIEVTDEAGFESDELTIVLDDTLPQIARPREGAKLEVSLGFEEWGPPVYVGTFVFEEIERDGPERTVTLIAKAADHAKTLKQPKTRAWEEKTFGQIVTRIAKDHGLKPAIANSLASHKIPYMAQTEESDQNFLTRLGRRVGAVIAPKDGHLVATERRSGKTAGGQQLPTIRVYPDRLVSDTAYHVRLKPRSRYSEVIARWQDRAGGRTRREVIETGSEGPSMTLREVFQSQPEARKAGEAKVRELRAGEGELSVELVGDPKARAECPIIVEGVSVDADGDWIASRVTHFWDYADGGGATTTVEAEFGMDEKDDKTSSNKERSSKTKAKRRKSSSPQKPGEYVSILDRRS
ncbi:MAG: hypothetical protein CSA70_03785 [Rhodobacterales bacterium]|nr:MAG: hypothetical protein CSA70_03785 [Rhodobacterales bacterium]